MITQRSLRRAYDEGVKDGWRFAAPPCSMVEGWTRWHHMARDEGWRDGHAQALQAAKALQVEDGAA